jgi:hypothetical protein
MNMQAFCLQEQRNKLKQKDSGVLGFGPALLNEILLMLGRNVMPSFSRGKPLLLAQQWSITSQKTEFSAYNPVLTADIQICDISVQDV